MDDLGLKVLRAICRSLPYTEVPRPGSVPDDDSGLARTRVCEALQGLMEAGEIENWRVLEVSPDYLEVSVARPGVLSLEAFRFDRPTLRETCAVMEVMES